MIWITSWIFQISILAFRLGIIAMHKKKATTIGMEQKEEEFYWMECLCLIILLFRLFYMKKKRIFFLSFHCSVKLSTSGLIIKKNSSAVTHRLKVERNNEKNINFINVTSFDWGVPYSRVSFIQIDSRTYMITRRKKEKFHEPNRNHILQVTFFLRILNAHFKSMNFERTKKKINHSMMLITF